MNLLILRFLDISFAIISLFILFPFILVICVLIKLFMGSPIIFTQVRVGFHGRPFKIYKFRSMSVNKLSDDVKQSHLEEQRINKLGKFLRFFFLDEIPQIYNIIIGDMSFVGPRPHEIGQDKEFEKKYPKYILRRNCLPGLTGLSQINGFAGPILNEEFMHGRIHYDLVYNERIGVKLYLYIIFKTIILITSKVYFRSIKRDN